MFCWFFRLMISHASDVGKQLSGLTKKHVRVCVGCRQLYETCQSLAEDLRREAAIVSHEAGGEALSGRILAAVTRRKRETCRVRVKFWRIATAACLSFVVLACVLVLATRNDDQAMPPPRPAIPPVGSWPGLASWNLAKAWPQLIEKPLAGEVKNLVDDTESAVRFLVTCVAMNLPDTEAESVN